MQRHAAELGREVASERLLVRGFAAEVAGGVAALAAALAREDAAVRGALVASAGAGARSRAPRTEGPTPPSTASGFEAATKLTAAVGSKMYLSL